MQALTLLVTGGLAVATLVFGAIRLLLEPHEVAAMGLARRGRRPGLIRGRGTAELAGAAGLVGSAALLVPVAHVVISAALLAAAIGDGIGMRRARPVGDLAGPAVSALLSSIVLYGLALDG